MDVGGRDVIEVGNVYHWKQNVSGFMRGFSYRHYRVISVTPAHVTARSLWTGKKGDICINRFTRDFVLVQPDLASIAGRKNNTGYNEGRC